MNVRKVLQRIDALHYSTFAFPCIYMYTQGSVECSEWEYMPSTFVNAGCKTVCDKCEFIYGQGSGYLRRKNVCFRSHGISKKGRYFFFFFSKF